MEELTKKIEACTKCDLCKSASRKVIGRGSLSPKVLFIGEAPGQIEDETGRPFSGKSGEILDKWIAYLELKKEDYAIINICKCKPPANRAPKPEEIAACAEYTNEQLKILNPSIIVPLGRTATSFILGDKFTTITECAGKSQIVKEKIIFPIFHPSWYLRNGMLDINPEVEKLKKLLTEPVAENLSEDIEKEQIENFEMNIQICEQLSYAEMISPVLCAVHNFCKMAGMQFIDKNQRDICIINDKLTLVADFYQTNEFDLFAEDLNEGGKYHSIKQFIFYHKEAGNFSFVGLIDREIVDSLEMGFHFKASKDCKKIMLDTLKPMTSLWKVFQEKKIEKRDTIQPFAHLHLHTNFSLGDSYGSVEEIAHALWKKGFNSAAITDHGTLGGTIYFQKALKEKNIKPILGMEAYIVNDDPKDDTFHITLLVKNEIGWKNLLKIQNNAVRNNFYYRPKIKISELLNNSEGLIAMSACVNGIFSKVIDNEQQTKDLVGALKTSFGDDFYIEMMPHNEVPGQIEYNKKLLDIAKTYGIKMVATCDCHYPNKEDKVVHNAIEAISRRKKYGEAGFSGNTYYYMQKEDIEKQFADYFPFLSGELEQMFKNSLDVVDKCNFEIKPFTFNSLPSVVENPNEKLRELAWEGLEAKGLGTNPVYKERMELELNRIIDKDYARYFLIVWDYVNFCKEKNIMCGVGRGSVGASLVAWCLGITGIDPIKYDLMFDRFISEMRKDAPDIDLDFEDSRREELVEYLHQKYGQNNVAKIATYSAWHAKGVIRDMGRIFDLPKNEVEKIANLAVVRCISGDSKVQLTGKNKLNIVDKKMKLERIYQIYQSKRKENRKLKAIVFNIKHNKFMSGAIKNVYYAGKKTLYSITTESGKNVEASEDHRFLTRDGWKKLKDLEENDEIMTCSEGKDFVKCRICGKILREVNTDHLREHGMNKKEYFAKFKNKDVCFDSTTRKGWQANKPYCGKKLFGKDNPMHKKKNYDKWYARINAKKRRKTHSKFMQNNNPMYDAKTCSKVMSKFNKLFKKGSKPQRRLLKMVKKFYKGKVKFDFYIRTKRSFRLLDVAIIDEKIDFEYDGSFWHETNKNRRDDKRRRKEIREMGWKVVTIKEKTLNESYVKNKIKELV